MQFARRRFLHLVGVTAAAFLLSVALAGHGALSQSSRTIKIVVPFAPGGAADTLARLLAEQISRAQVLPVVVENRPGAGSVIGTKAVSRATPDGNTVLMIGNSFVINPNLKKVNFDPLISFEPICDLVSSPNVIVVNSASPYRTLSDLLGAARMKPGELTLASTAPATSQHIAFELLKRAANVDITHVPFAGAAPAVTALLGEHVTSVLADYAAVAEQLNAGKLRALATTSRMRAEPLPNVPTVAESGYTGYEANSWQGLVAPANTPKETVSQLAGWFTTAMQVPEVKAKLVVQGLYPAGICGADFGAFLRKQYADYGRAIREANIKVE
jgi:tripartite-type tricarboxylate transporter receptor subunit TctC